MKSNFYNTINVRGIELDEAIKKVTKQTERILTIFKQADKILTPFQVQDIYLLLWGSVPITSIRRAITDLTSDGHLVKTQEQRVGHYGSKNYCWRISNSSDFEGEQTKLF